MLRSETRIDKWAYHLPGTGIREIQDGLERPGLLRAPRTPPEAPP